MKRNIFGGFLTCVLLSTVFLVLVHFGWNNSWLTIVVPSAAIFVTSATFGSTRNDSPESHVAGIVLASILAFLAATFSILVSLIGTSPVYTLIFSVSLFGNASFVITIWASDTSHRFLWGSFCVTVLIGAFISAVVIFGPTILPVVLEMFD